MQLLLHLWNFIAHIDVHLIELAASMGGGLYLLLFLIVFAETGLVVTPFLPGDSLLFAVGALCALDHSPLNLELACALLLLAAVLGDAVNYAIGLRVGPKVFRSESSIWLNTRHLHRTADFFARYGGKTLIIARFVPIIRTFAPFVAGIGQMHYRRFFAFNVIGAVAWVLLFVPLGYFFGNLPLVKRNFSWVILGIIGLSVLPAVVEILRGWLAARRAQEQISS